MDYYKIAGEVRYGLAYLLGRIDASIRVPECALTLEETKEALEGIRAKAAALHDGLTMVRPGAR